MYQWINPETGRTQLSGKAPPWYRSESGGPRVLVFENNRLVDDTAIPVDEEQRLELRRKALALESKKKKGLTQEEALASLEKQIQAIVESPEMELFLQNPTPSNTHKPITEPTVASIEENTDRKREKTENKALSESTDERIERLKALISAWDESRTQEAKSLIKSKMGAELEEPVASGSEEKK